MSSETTPSSAGSRRPATALVIPGRNCEATIEQCLSAVVPLLRQGDLSEIVFVDDHSTDGTRRVVATFPDVRVIESAGHGAGAARNSGWRATGSELVWFIDADCVAEPDALSRLQASRLELSADAIGGSYENLQPGLLAELIHEEMVGRHRAMGRRVTFAITANLLCSRRVLDALGGFDESLKLAQDLDLAYRIDSAGYRLSFDVTSRVGHFHETRLWHYCYKQGRQGYWRMHLYARHPGRVSGDSYSGWVDYAQPPLALLALAGPLGGLITRGLLKRVSFAIGGGGMLGLAALQLPHTLRLLARTGRPRVLAYAPMAMLRAGFRGIGMAIGVAELAFPKRVTPD